MTDTVNVPREPTPDMWSAGERAFDRDPDLHHETVLANVWSAMLEAAPKAEPVSDPYKLVTAADIIAWVKNHPHPTSWVATTNDIKTIVETMKPDQLPEAPKVEQDYAELKRLAEGASQGPWKACGTIYEHMNCEIRTGAKGEGQPIGQIWDGPNAYADGQFIAAASPQVVLGLIARASSPAPASDELLEAKATVLDSLLSAEIDGRTAKARLIEYRTGVLAISQHKGAQS